VAEPIVAPDVRERHDLDQLRATLRGDFFE
jgi:hypothetical protein